MTATEQSGRSLREWMEQNPSASFDLLTPCGYVYLTPEKVAEVLAGADVPAHPGVPGCEQMVSAEELFAQTIETSNYTDGVWHIMTVWPEQDQGFQMGGMTMG